MKRLILCLLMASSFLMAQTGNPKFIRLADSTYYGQLRGKTGYRTSGTTLQGIYKSGIRAHRFLPTLTGPYELWVSSDGITYIKDSDWSYLNGSLIMAIDDITNAADFVAKVDPDGNDSLNASFIEDSTVSLQKFTTAAYNFIGSGGTVTNNPDDLTLENKGGSTIGVKGNYLETQLQYKDTLSMTNAIFDSVGFVINLKQLSSVNNLGGGSFEVRPAAEFVVDGMTVYSTGSASYELVRTQRIQGGPVLAEWAGAIPNDAVDDYDELMAAMEVVLTYNLPYVKLTEGTWNLSTPLFISGSKANEEDWYWQGAGRRHTIIQAADTAFGRDRTGYTRGVIIKDMTIVGPGNSTAGSVGINASYWTNPQIENVYVEQFKYGLDGDRLQGGNFVNCFWDDCDFAVRAIGNTINGNTWRNNYTSSTDSIDFYISNGFGNAILGGEGGNCPIYLKVGIDGSNFGEVNVQDLNLESVDSTFVLVGNNSRVMISNTRGLLASATDITHWARVLGSGTLYIGPNMTLTNGKIYQAGVNSKVILTYSQAATQQLKGYNATDNTWFSNSQWETIFDNGFSSLIADTNKAGRLTRVLPRKSVQANLQEKLIYHYTHNAHEEAISNLLGLVDIRTATSDVQPNHNFNNFSVVFKYFDVTFSSGDSTIYTAKIDTNGWNNIWWCNALFDDVANSGYKNITFAGWETSDGSAGTGTVDLIFRHDNPTVASITRRVRMFAVYQAKEWAP